MQGGGNLKSPFILCVAWALARAAARVKHICSVYTCTRKSTVRDIADSVIVHLHDYETCKIEIMWMCGCESFIYFTPRISSLPPSETGATRALWTRLLGERPVCSLGARARAGVIFLLSAYSLSYLISISAAVSAKACGLCALYSAPRARQQLARIAAVCVRSMWFSIHFYRTRPHRHACANLQRRNRSGLASRRVACAPPLS